MQTVTNSYRNLSFMGMKAKETSSPDRPPAVFSPADAYKTKPNLKDCIYEVYADSPVKKYNPKTSKTMITSLQSTSKNIVTQINENTTLLHKKQESKKQLTHKLEDLKRQIAKTKRETKQIKEESAHLLEAKQNTQNLTTKKTSKTVATKKALQFEK